MMSRFYRALTIVVCSVAVLSTLNVAVANAHAGVRVSGEGVGCQGAPSPSILVTLPDLNGLAFIDPATQQIEQVDSIGGAPGPIIMDPRRPLVFIATTRGIEYFDLHCQRVIGSVSLPNGFGDMQINEAGTELFVVDFAGHLLVISISTGKVIQTITLDSFGSAVAYSHDAHELFVPEPGIDRIGVVDMPSGTSDHVIFQGKCGGLCRPFDAETTPGGQYLFSADFNGGYAVFDATTHRILLNSSGRGRVDRPILGGFDPSLNGMSLMYDVVTPVRAAVVSATPPFQTLISWTVPGLRRLRMQSSAFDPAGVGYVAEDHGVLLLYPDGSTKTLELGTRASGTAYYP